MDPKTFKTFKIGKHANVLAVSPNGRLVARCVPNNDSQYQNTNVYVYDCEEKKEIYNVQQFYMISALTFSHDNKLLAVGSTDGSVTIHDITTKEIISDYQHENAVESVCFSKDNTQIVSGSEDGTAIVWDIKNFEPIQVFGQNGEWIRDAKFVNENDVAIIHDCCVEIWNIPRGNLSAFVRYERKGDLDDLNDYFDIMPYAIAYNEATHQIAVKTNKKLRIYETKDLHEIIIIEADAQIQNFEFSRDGSLLVYATKNEIVVLDAKTFEILKNHRHPFKYNEYHTAVGFCSDDMQIYVKATKDSNIHFFYSVKRKQNIASFLLASKAKETNPVKRFVNDALFDNHLLASICKYL